MINSKVASFANFSGIKLSIFVLAASSELDSSSFMIAVFAKTFGVELSVCVFTLGYLTNLLAIGPLLNQGRRWFLLATNFLNGSNLLIDRLVNRLSVILPMILFNYHTRGLCSLISIFRLIRWQHQWS